MHDTIAFAPCVKDSTLEKFLQESLLIAERAEV